MKAIEIFTVQVEGKTYAYDRESLARTKAPVPGDDPEREPIPTFLTEKADVEKVLGEGHWNTLHLKPFTGAMHAAVERKLLEKDKETGQLERNGTRFEAVLVEIAVESWDFDYATTEEGYLKMPYTLANLIGNLVAMACYDNLHPALDPFTRPSAAK